MAVSQYFLGQIMMTGFGFAQKGFGQCDGYLVPVQQNSALFSLLGTYYGGDGIRTFALPDLRGRTPMGAGASVDPNWQPPVYPIGLIDGTETVTLTTATLPPHNHTAAASTSAGTSAAPVAGGLLAKGANNVGFYAPAAAPIVQLAPATIGETGDSASHPNIQPCLTINFNIALTGIFPSRN